MSLRAQTITAIILVATLSLVFILVSGMDLNTNVFSADPTATPIPPTPTAAPTGSADNWQQDETQPTRWTYTGQENITADMVVQEMPLAQVVSSLQVSPPAADAPFPLLDILEQFKAGVAADLGPTVQISEPSIQIFDGVPVALLHITSQPDEATFPAGIDYLLALTDRGNDNATYIQAVNQGPPNEQFQQDFRAWLTAHASEFGPTGEDETPDEPASQPTETGSQPESGTDGTPTPIPAEPTDAPIEEPTDEPRTEADATPAAEQPTWSEVGPGQLLYSGTSNALAQIVYGQVNLTDFIAQSALEMPADDSDTPALDILQQVVDQLAQQIEAQNISIADDAITGPEMFTFGDVQVALARIRIGPQTLESGQEFPGNDLGLGLIDVGEGRLQTVQYMLQGEPNNAVYEEYLGWLADNAEMLSVPDDPRPVEPPAAEPTGTPEAE